MIQIYNSLTKTKEPLQPIHKGKVGIYVCGVTVYDYCHIGHARVYLCFDMITRYLRSLGYEVNYVRNITDIDDKIIDRSHQNRESIDTLTERFIKAFHEDMEALNAIPPNHEPRATKHLPEIIDMVQRLLDKNHAYIADNGDVYFRVRSFPNYGGLAHKDLEDLKVGARVDVTEVKEDPLDFVLWKMAKANEPQWDSPWGPGRPGWHIECSAMSTHCLGNHFDIHGGGFDLKFPHHENEVAQAEAANAQPFVNTWMHVGFVQVNKEKMSKSLGNFFTIREVLKQYPAEVVRYFLLSSHYRSPVNYSQENLDLAYNTLERLYTALRGLPNVKPCDHSDYQKQFQQVMNDDFNTPEALGVLFAIAHDINRCKSEDKQKAGALGALLRQLGAILGILQDDANDFLRGGLSDDEHERIENLIAERQRAREEKNWQQADKLRDALTAMGVSLEDSREGTTWRKTSS